MCQGLGCCDCIYYNQCHSCIGLSAAMFCCSCWLCVPEALSHLRVPGCCKCEFNQGCGYSCFCIAEYCCIPNYLREYSIWSSIGEKRGLIYDLYISKQAIVQKEFRGPESNRNLYWFALFMIFKNETWVLT
jgi:hypothetical protein